MCPGSNPGDPPDRKTYPHFSYFALVSKIFGKACPSLITN